MTLDKLLKTTNRNVLVNILDQISQYLVNGNVINNVKKSFEKDFSEVNELTIDDPLFGYIPYLYDIIINDNECRQRLFVDTLEFIIFTKNGLPLVGIKNTSSTSKECLIIDIGCLTKELNKVNKENSNRYKTLYNSAIGLVTAASLVSMTWLLSSKKYN